MIDTCMYWIRSWELVCSATDTKVAHQAKEAWLSGDEETAVLSDFWGSHGEEHEDQSFLGYSAV
jgi:hypothetical protein